MTKLAKFTLTYNESNSRWDLKSDNTDNIVKTFKSKIIATKRGVLQKSVGPEGGSIKIQKMNGKFQEERTYPKSKDPKSKG